MSNIPASPGLTKDVYKDDMTPLDYFAGQALTGMLSDPNHIPAAAREPDLTISEHFPLAGRVEYLPNLEQRFARDAYRYAAAMIAERKKYEVTDRIFSGEVQS